jgi:hypothetical protein
VDVVAARRSGAVSTTRSQWAAATASRTASSPGRRHVAPLKPSSRHTYSSQISSSWSAHHARNRASCGSLVCCWACRWVETRRSRARRMVYLLVSRSWQRRGSGRRSSAGGWAQWLTRSGPLHEQLVRLVPPALPVGGWMRLATQAPWARHETLLAEHSQKHSCGEDIRCGEVVPCALAADDVTRSS